jgi:hypothetical protein
VRLQKERPPNSRSLSRKKAKERLIVALNLGGLIAAGRLVGLHGVAMTDIGVPAALWLLLSLALWLWAFRRWPVDAVAARRWPW